MNRQEVFEWCRQRYGTEPDYPWNDRNAVLRHADNNRWYGVIIEIDRSKLWMDGIGAVDVLNVKCDPTIIGMLRMQAGFYPAYHMNKEKWVSILLGGPASDEAIKELIDFSYRLTSSRKNESKHIIDRLNEIAPVYVVRGNNDKEWAENLPESLTCDRHDRKRKGSP